MKKLLYLIRNAVFGIFVLLALAISPFVVAACQPFLYAKYRKSRFFRDTGVKYQPGITDSMTYRLYEMIHEHTLPIRYLLPSDPRQGSCGWFLAGSTLLIHDLPALFYHESLGGWTACPEDGIPLSDTVADILRQLRNDYPDTPITDVRILISFRASAAEDRSRAQQDPLFLIYDAPDQLPALLKRLWESQSP